MTIRTRVWRNGTLEAEDFPIEQFSDYLAQGDCVVYADSCTPTTTTIGVLADELSLDQHAVEDAMSDNERPKVARYPNHLFMTAYTPSRSRATRSPSGAYRRSPSNTATSPCAWTTRSTSTRSPSAGTRTPI